MEHALSFEHVSFSYHTPEGETTTLKDISFSINPGEFVSIVGPSGCGKSTLLSLCSGLLSPESGQVILHNHICSDSRTAIGYMLQHDHLFEWRSIYHNVVLGLEINHMMTAKYRDKVQALLTQYGLEEFADSKPSELSGGMRQRAALVRTLVLEPELLLLDEPFSSLDYQTRLNVSNDIGMIIRQEHKTALLVTHDLGEAISMSDRVIVLSNRPATVRQTIPIVFPEENDTPLNRRNTPEFKSYFNLIWKELNGK